MPPSTTGRGNSSKWSTCGYYTKNILVFLVSHIGLVSLVVGYCVIGAFAFEALEATNELQVKRNVSQIRRNVTSSIWSLTQEQDLLHEYNWTAMVGRQLKEFEKQLIEAMKTKGWDGSEDDEHQQWTFAGALFYSIVVITTIGYGHIAPKTDWGKVVTMLYAILGIPLMCLCLSNISEGMAHSFKVVYWKCCCYICTKKPKKRRRRRGRRGYSSSRSIRRSAKNADGAVSESAFSASYGDPSSETGEYRLPDDVEPASPDAYGRAAIHNHRLPADGKRSAPSERSKSSDELPATRAEPDPAALQRTPFFQNRYALSEADALRDEPSVGSGGSVKLSPARTDSAYGRSLSSGARSVRGVPAGRPAPERVSKLHQTFDEEDDSDGYEDSDDEDTSETKSVPIWLCVLLVVSYIVGGAYLFKEREQEAGWTFLDSAYFCFITLTTIGFGDFVPDQKRSGREGEAIAITSLYLLFGIALLMMSFNLVQEEVISSVKSVAKKLGIIKDDEDEYDDY
ncbi:potassium channel subfamily K member 18-like [Amphibalanus amphitrite]|uniref:potassium channel subfamily K member 18-like n=1 Tax=Amphibalanus amphitrite TaxID=1232801 RepID=UPI001C90FC91|nr:potassium channel subfamily K member 18-like [Amphibalanus amphitrite]